MRNIQSNIIRRNKRLIRFCIVGGICTIVDAVIYYSLIRVISYKQSLIIGYILGLAINYILTTYWTFSSKPNIKNAIGVISIHLLNCFVVRIGLMSLFVNILYVNNMIAYIPTIIISVLFTFSLIKLVFKITNKSHQYE